MPLPSMQVIGSVTDGVARQSDTRTSYPHAGHVKFGRFFLIAPPSTPNARLVSYSCRTSIGLEPQSQGGRPGVSSSSIIASVCPSS